MPTRSWRTRLIEAARKSATVLAHVLYDVKSVHAERIPLDGAVIVVSNHVGFLDGPMVYLMAPRQLHFLVKRSYFDSPWGFLLRFAQQIPIDQNSGDRVALRAARDVLAEGGGLGIFPEGTRTAGAVQTAQQGAAFLAQATGARVVPVAVLGTRGRGGRDSWPRLRSPLRLVVGEPFTLERRSGLSGRQRLRLATEELRTKLADHVTFSAAETGLPLAEAATG